jgi:aminoglycoside 6'-N-acetyltransferase I
MVHIRLAERGDGAEWAALRAALWPDVSVEKHALEVEEFFAKPRDGVGKMPEVVFVALAAEGSSTLIGFAEVSRRLYAEGCDTSPVGFLEGWYVAPEYRRTGVGRALVQAAAAWARSTGCQEFASDALADNVVSAAAHRAIGFEEVEIIRCFRKSLDHTPDR